MFNMSMTTFLKIKEYKAITVKKELVSPNIENKAVCFKRESEVKNKAK